MDPDRWTQTDPVRPGQNPDGPGWVPLGSTRFLWVPLGSSGFYYTDVFNDRLLGANLQLVPGCYTLAA